MFLYPYVLLGVIVFLINCAPAFVPPTWTVLVLFSITYHIPLIPLILIGVVAATAGRVVLYFLAKHFGRFFFSQSSKENLEALGTYFNNKKNMTFFLFLGYAFVPLPSNQLFITAGLAKANIKTLALAFAFGRLFSYTWTVLTSQFILSRTEWFSGTTREAIIIQLLGFVGIYLLSKVNWKQRLFKK